MATHVPFQHILVATDFGNASAHAVDVAAELATRYGARLTVLHVVEDAASSYTMEGIAVPVSVFEDLERAARAELDRTLASLKERVPRSEGVLRHGSPAGEILACVEEARCDLAVIGTHGRRGPARWLLGSVAEKVVRASQAAVLTVRAEPPRDR